MFTSKQRTLRVVAACAAAGALAAGAAACGSDEDGAAVSAGAGTNKQTAGDRIGFSLPMLNAPFYVAQIDLTKNAAGSEELDLLAPTDAKSDPGKQITDIRNLIAAGAEGLLVTPRDSDAITPVLEYAEREKVPVVAVDQGANAGKVAITVRADNLLMGQQACREVGKAIGGEGKVLELQGDLLNVNGRDRAKGFEDCIAKEFPGIEVIARPTKWEQAQTASATQTVLTANPDVKAIYMASDSIMLSPVLGVLKNRGKDAKVGEPGHIYLIGIDGAPEALKEVRAGRMDATISQPLDQYAALSVKYLKEAMGGKEFSPGPTDHGSEIRREGPNLTDFLTAPVVTKKNVDDPKLWANQESVSG